MMWNSPMCLYNNTSLGWVWVELVCRPTSTRNGLIDCTHSHFQVHSGHRAELPFAVAGCGAVFIVVVVDPVLFA